MILRFFYVDTMEGRVRKARDRKRSGTETGSNIVYGPFVHIPEYPNGLY